MRSLGFTAIMIGPLLAAPTGLVLVASAGGGSNLAVVAPGLAWLLWVVPAGGLIGVGLLLMGISLVVIALRRDLPSAS